jgi:hypothetical protein
MRLSASRVSPAPIASSASVWLLTPSVSMSSRRSTRPMVSEQGDFHMLQSVHQFISTPPSTLSVCPVM